MNVNFYLKYPNSKVATLIYLFFSYDNKRFKYSTAETIVPKYWNDEAQRAKKSLTGSSEINRYLDRIDASIRKIYRDGKEFGKIISSEYLKENLDIALERTAKDSMSLFDHFNEFLEAQKPFKTLRTIQKYNTLQTHLLKFQRTQRHELSFEKMDSQFYERFTSFCIDELNLVNNSIAKYIKTLKSFLQWSTERDYNTNLSFKKFKAKERDADIIYLTEKELFKLYDLDLTNNCPLEAVRDVFCFGCFTGLRFSDIKKIKRENIKEGDINLVSEKTTEKIRVPLNQYSEAILKKYNYSLPVISNQKTNEHLKNLGKLGEINEPTVITRFQGVEEIQVTKPKYEFIGTHTARRTFVTLSLEKGMRPEVVMSITGHKEYNTFKKYIKLTSKVKNMDMKRIWNNENRLVLNN
ncbi:MAG: site-specific integrase [Saprospiraceae bacterium]|nr:site-specific integrase [Saprospiraceae bacterium]MBK9722128.1 site-specific integrase [Saprospiraceae bacterium]